jgi:hypothetical protein
MEGLVRREKEMVRKRGKYKSSMWELNTPV